MRPCQSWVGLLVAVGFCVCGISAAAQPASEQGPAALSAPSDRIGLIRAGSLYLTPYLYLGGMGIDTNVFYTATDRQTDFFASGGPGLEVVRPLGRSAKSRIRLDGAVDYLYYANTESLRRLNGHGSALLELHGVKTDLVVEESYRTSFSRPNSQVNDRVQQELEGTQGLLKRRLADRFQLAVYGLRLRNRTDSQDYLGTDLRATMSEDEYQGGGELRLALTVKTQMVAGGEASRHRFVYAPERDGRTTLAFGGFRTDETALITGEALVGVRWFRLDSGGTRDVVYANVNATWRLSPKTKLGGRYTRDLEYSVFSTSGPTPTNVSETVELSLDKMLARTIYMRLYGQVGTLRSDGAIAIDTPNGPAIGVRDDRARDAGLEIGYQFRSRVRIGATATYASRHSNFQTFGIDGLIAGLRVTYNPPQPRFR